MKHSLGTWISSFISRLLLLRYSLFSGKVLSVRALCFNEKNEVYLVRHTYTPGWHLPGGGVDNGKSAEEALRQELAEEGNLSFAEQPGLQQVYFKAGGNEREHVIFYHVKVRQEQPFGGTLEISEGRFFPVGELPDDLDPAANRRITEWVTGLAAQSTW